MICAFRLRLFSLVLFPLFGYWHSATAQDAAEMARMLQDPLANIKALMTDNDINFNAGNDQTSYGFQLQPVCAVSFDKAGFNLINRAVIPIIGMLLRGMHGRYPWGLALAKPGL